MPDTDRPAATGANLREAFRKVGVSQGNIVCLATCPGIASEPVLTDIRQAIGPSGTIVADSATPSLLASGAPFDTAMTPAEDPLGEAVRRLPEARRSLHPFRSFAAQGPQAAALMENAGPHELGPETPPGRLVAREALAVTVGGTTQDVAGRLAEFAMAVPYRYTREILHPVRFDGATSARPFYLHLPWPDTGLEHDGGVALFERVCADGLTVRSTEIAGVEVSAWRMSEFYRLACAALRSNLYLGCTRLPQKRPYRQ